MAERFRGRGESSLDESQNVRNAAQATLAAVQKGEFDDSDWTPTVLVLVGAVLMGAYFIGRKFYAAA